MEIGEKVLIILISVRFSYLGFANQYRCGVDNSLTTDVNEGVANIETYPWLGLLFYPVSIDDDLVTTTIVLITRRMSLAAALDIDKYPKNDFRAHARVVLGHNCSGPHINVRDYTYHPDFSKTTYSTLAIIQLDTMMIAHEIRPICAPPSRMRNAQVYAMSLTQDCTSSAVRIHKMEYVNESECKEFYRRSNLDMESLWPTHYACARATRGGHCVWRSGTVLVIRDNDNKWRLLGFGVYGPGCESPARFLDYGVYSGWVKRSIAKIGRPAVTRMGPDHIILRRTVDRVQRFGPCDPEEKFVELFTDYTSVQPKNANDSPDLGSTVYYNLTLITNVDYSCISLRVYSERTETTKPTILLRRWCTNPRSICYDFGILQISFYVEIKFIDKIVYKISAYGKEIKLIDVKAYRLYTNKLFYGQGLPLPGMHDPNHKYSFMNFVTSAPSPYPEFDQNPQVSGVLDSRP